MLMNGSQRPPAMPVVFDYYLGWIFILAHTPFHLDYLWRNVPTVMPKNKT
jgi:hypothetical protein